MLAIEVELLTGRYAATAYNDRTRAEWPPHPARFFSALVAALHDKDPVDQSERAALLWLEQQDAPQLDVDIDVDENIGRRDVRPVFVPVNDVSLVGNRDPEADLRQKREELANLANMEKTKEAKANIKAAEQAVGKAEKNLAKFLEAQFSLTDSNPSKKDLERGTQLLPDRRNRQERTFPVVIPERPTFSFIWPQAVAAAHLESLHQLCERVTRLGHSSSLVRCAIVAKEIAPTLIPQSTGEYVLRVVGAGQLRNLEDSFSRHQAVSARVLPARPQRYDRPNEKPKAPARSSVFADDWIVFERIDGQRPLSSRGSDLAISLRRALLEINGKKDLPAMLSGHEADGKKSAHPHLAFVSLPWVGHEHADGSVQGLALILPRSIIPGEREQLMRLLAKWESERGTADNGYSIELGTSPDLGRPLQVRLRRIEVPLKATLNSARWCKPAQRFITATPIALDRHPGNLRSNNDSTARKAAAEAESAIIEACKLIGLPSPTSVSISLAPLLPGAQHVQQFSPWPPQPGKIRRARIHAEIIFPEAVQGPLLIGAGRYFGLGLCLPILGKGESHVTRSNS